MMGIMILKMMNDDWLMVNAYLNYWFIITSWLIIMGKDGSVMGFA